MSDSLLTTTLSLRLDWSEMDLFGHINNVQYFKYVQASRVNLWQATSLYDSFLKNNIGPILAHTECNFIKPVHFPGNIIIKAETSFIKNTSFGIHHTLLNEKNEICATADDVLVYYNFNMQEKEPLPDWLRKELTV